MGRFRCIAPLLLHTRQKNSDHDRLSPLLKMRRQSLLELINLFFFGINSSLNPLKSLDLFVYQLIFYHLNGVMDLHSKCPTALLYMSCGLLRPWPRSAQSPELHSLTNRNHSGKFFSPHKLTAKLVSSVTCQVSMGQKPVIPCG